MFLPAMTQTTRITPSVIPTTPPVLIPEGMTMAAFSIHRLNVGYGHPANWDTMHMSIERLNQYHDSAFKDRSIGGEAIRHSPYDE